MLLISSTYTEYASKDDIHEDIQTNTCSREWYKYKYIHFNLSYVVISPYSFSLLLRDTRDKLGNMDLLELTDKWYVYCIFDF